MHLARGFAQQCADRVLTSVLRMAFGGGASVDAYATHTSFGSDTCGGVRSVRPRRTACCRSSEGVECELGQVGSRLACATPSGCTVPCIAQEMICAVRRLPSDHGRFEHRRNTKRRAHSKSSLRQAQPGQTAAHRKEHAGIILCHGVVTCAWQRTVGTRGACDSAAIRCQPEQRHKGAKRAGARLHLSIK